MFVVVPASGGAPGPGPPPPRRCFRTPSPSQGRGGAPLVLRATPRPRSPAAGRTEAAECPFLAAVRDLLQGNRRCFCPGWERGAGVPEGEARAAPGQLPQAPLPAADPRPHTHPGGIPHCSGRGRARGSPQPPPLTTRGAAPAAFGRASHLRSLGPPSSPWGVGGADGARG